MLFYDANSSSPPSFPVFGPAVSRDKRRSGFEGITLALGNAPHSIINKTTVILGATKRGIDTNHNFDGFSLATAVVESLALGHKGLKSINPLTGLECIIRVHCIGIRCDSPMVRR